MLNKTLVGLVVELPVSSGSGVVLDATRQGKDLYKATIITNDGAVLIAQFRANSTNVGEDITYVDYHGYYPNEISKLL